MTYSVTLKRLLLTIASILLLVSCSKKEFGAQEIIDTAIENSGGQLYQNSEITFDFRDRSYRIKREGGLFEMSRYTYISQDSTIEDYVYNYGYKRFINDSMVSVPDSMAPKYKASVNSVIYFASLPYGLNDLAVEKKLIGRKEIKGISYFKIKVTFKEQGGGEDYKDQFIYWIHPKTYAIDYLAYEYFTDGGGMRFRQAFNRREINGISFNDYINFKPKVDSKVNLQNIDDQFIASNLDELSRIQTENVVVSIFEK